MNEDVKDLLFWSCAGFALLMIFVLGTESTFGQRCAKAHIRDTPEFATCVDRLAHHRAPTEQDVLLCSSPTILQHIREGK